MYREHDTSFDLLWDSYSMDDNAEYYLFSEFAVSVHIFITREIYLALSMPRTEKSEVPIIRRLYSTSQWQKHMIRKS